ncbi:MAG: serine protease [Planctomycetota bacterium]|nr:serine protease [Planctomycetota bacterium]
MLASHLRFENATGNQALNDIKSCIVGVLVDGELQGTGYVVTGTLVITCAHVLTDESQPPEQGVSIRFHSSGVECPVDVSTDWWSESDQNDIAALILSKPLPPGVEIARLAKSAGRKNRVCEVFGYPNVGNLNGLGGRAKVIEEVIEFDGRRLLQLQSSEATCGYSGAPLYDPATGEVIGTVVEIVEHARARYADDLHARLQELAFATPSEFIAELIPDLPFDSDEDLDAHERALTRVRDGVQKILSNYPTAATYLAKQIGGMDDYIAEKQRESVTARLLGASLSDFMPLVMQGFVAQVKTDRNVAHAFRELATYLLPKIYKEDFLREVRRRIEAGDRFLVIPASHKSIIELVMAGVFGRKLGFPETWPPLDDVPSAADQIAPCAEFGIMAGENLDRFIESFEHAIMQKTRVGGVPRGLRDPTRAINRRLAALRSEEPPVVYYFVYPDGHSRVEELESRYPNVVFVAHEWTDHDDQEVDILFSLREMFCSESDQ